MLNVTATLHDVQFSQKLVVKAVCMLIVV